MDVVKVRRLVEELSVEVYADVLGPSALKGADGPDTLSQIIAALTYIRGRYGTMGNMQRMYEAEDH